MDSIEAKNGGRPSVPNRQGLYAKAAKHAELAIDTLADLLNSKNENLRLGAAKAILDKCLPDLKASSLSTGTENPIPIMDVKFIAD